MHPRRHILAVPQDLLQTAAAARRESRLPWIPKDQGSIAGVGEQRIFNLDGSLSMQLNGKLRPFRHRCIQRQRLAVRESGQKQQNEKGEEGARTEYSIFQNSNDGITLPLRPWR